MVERRFGYVLLVASIGAYQPSPTYATYSAAKSYVLFFGEALHYELRKTGVTVTVVSPSITKTEFLDVAGHLSSLYQRTMMMESPDVTRHRRRRHAQGQSQRRTGLQERCAGPWTAT